MAILNAYEYFCLEYHTAAKEIPKKVVSERVAVNVFIAMIFVLIIVVIGVVLLNAVLWNSTFLAMKLNGGKLRQLYTDISYQTNYGTN